jgi:hypothetical protein
MLEKIRAACAEGRVQWRNHALERMMERGISRQQVKKILMEGDVIASYQDDSPYPSLLLDGRSGREVLHVVVAFDEAESYCYVITAYRPDREHFENDLKTRRK